MAGLIQWPRRESSTAIRERRNCGGKCGVLFGKNDTEYFSALPIFPHIFPNSGPVVSEKSAKGRKFHSPAPFCPISSHPVFASCSQLIQGASRRTGIHEGTVGSSSHTKIWYGGAMRLGKRQMSSKYPNAIALGVARYWLDTAPMAHQNLP